MRQKTSLAGLYLRMTALPVAILFLLVGGLQLLWFQPPQLVEGRFLAVFEHQLQAGFPQIGTAGLLLLILLLVGCGSQTKGGDFSMTLGRLGLSPLTRQLILAGVCTGYFLLYWAFQFLMVVILFARSAPVMAALYEGTAPGERLDPIWFFLSCYRMPYVHFLMPLRDGFGYLRNLFLALACGMWTAYSCPWKPRRSWPLVTLILTLNVLRILPMHSPATQVTCIAQSLICLILTAIALHQMKGREEHEKI